MTLPGPVFRRLDCTSFGWRLRQFGLKTFRPTVRQTVIGLLLNASGQNAVAMPVPPHDSVGWGTRLALFADPKGDQLQLVSASYFSNSALLQPGQRSARRAVRLLSPAVYLRTGGSDWSARCGQPLVLRNPGIDGSDGFEAEDGLASTIVGDDWDLKPGAILSRMDAVNCHTANMATASSEAQRPSGDRRKDSNWDTLSFEEIADAELIAFCNQRAMAWVAPARGRRTALAHHPLES
jgi:hypothetical protein